MASVFVISCLSDEGPRDTVIAEKRGKTAFYAAEQNGRCRSGFVMRIS